MKGLKYLLAVLATVFLVLVLSTHIDSPLKAAQITATPMVMESTTEFNLSSQTVIITSPLIVSELHGQVNVQGTANLPNMDNYFLEMRALNDDASIPGDDVPWIPASLPISNPVQGDLLATWDTTTVPDGLYELRLTVSIDNAPSVNYVVTPLRINNAAYAAPTPIAIQPTPTQIALDFTPRVTAVVTANVRTGDSVAYPAVSFLIRGDNAQVLGISSTGSGWYFIQLEDGITGWIAPFVVMTSGNFSTVLSVTPPPLPVTPTPTPMPVAPNLQLTNIALNPFPPTCEIPFNAVVNVTNVGTGPSAATVVFAQDVHLASGTVTTSGIGSVPPLDPGASYAVSIPLTVTTYYNEDHQIRVDLGDSQITMSYTLTQGRCNVPPTAIPTSTPRPAAPPTRTPIPAAPHLLLDGIALNPSTPGCGVAFNVVVNIANVGTGPSGAAVVYVQDVHAASGTVTTSGAGVVPPLAPHTRYTVGIPLIVTTYYNEAHQIQAKVGDGQITTSYTLAQGQCNALSAAIPTSTPPPPATLTPTPVPVTPHLLLDGIALDPSTPGCGVAFNVVVNVTNIGNGPSSAASLSVEDIRQASGTATASVTGAVPPLKPGAKYTVGVPLTVTTYYNEAHQIQAKVGDSQITTSYTLAQGRCNVPTTAIPSSTPPPPPATPTFTHTAVPPKATSTTPNTPIPPPATQVVDLLTVPYIDVNDPAVLAEIRQIYSTAKAQGINPGNFRIVGDTTLVGIAGVDDPKAVLDQYKAQYAPVVQFFSPGIKAADSLTTDARFTSADVLKPAKGSAECRNKSPLDCALDSKPALVLINVGRNDIAAKIPLDQFSANLTTAVNAAIQRGSVPILVTIIGVSNPADEARLSEYNMAIYNVAKAAHIPLFNLYRVRKDNPALINPKNGELTASPHKWTDLSLAGLQFGVNVATLHTLELLSSLKNTVPLP